MLYILLYLLLLILHRVTVWNTFIQLRRSVIKSVFNLEFVSLHKITLDTIRATYLTYVEFNKNQTKLVKPYCRLCPEIACLS